jgi:hypothetical protein
VDDPDRSSVLLEVGRVQQRPRLRRSDHGNRVREGRAERRLGTWREAEFADEDHGLGHVAPPSSPVGS